MDNLLGKQIEQYRIEALLGEGGMGSVYRAFDVNLARYVALKVMHRQFATQSQFQQRFMQEAQAIARLSHPSIVVVFNFENKQGLLYIVMEFVRGLSLGAYIKQLIQRQQVMKLNETAAIMAQVADALGYAHRQGVVHRDIKPDNILIKKLDQPERPGEPPLRSVVTDFGLAKMVEGGVETQSGTFMGTLPYMSPEQALAKPVDGRSDIYSLGVVLYQLATGRLPFDIKTPTEAVLKHLNEMPPEPRQIQPGVPTALEQVILKALAKKPEDRYQTAEAFALALRQAAQGLTDKDVTVFATAVQGQVVSMVTRLQEIEDLPMPSQFAADVTALGNIDRLTIARQGQPPKLVNLDKPTLTIGRGKDNDLVLEGDGVSRKHARLERTATGWRIVDLGSTNGTLMDSSRLLPDVPEPWLPSQTLQIGPFFLKWQPASRPSSTQPGALTYQATQTPVGGSQIHSSTGQLSLIITPTNPEVAAGGRANLQVEFFNQGPIVEHFSVRVDGLDKTWVTAPTDAIQLMPGTRGSLPVVIHPPQDSSAKSGQYPYRLVVTSRTNAQDTAAVSGVVTIHPFERFVADMRPKQLKNHGLCRILVRNEGNADSTFTVTGRDPGEAIQFGERVKRVQVAAGQSGTADFEVAPKKRPYFGRSQTLNFEMVVAGGKEQQSLSGQLEVTPVIPSWVMPVAGVLLLLLCIGGAILLQSLMSRQDEIASAQQAMTATYEAVITAVAEGTRQANESSAVTATALALTAQAAGDDDGDGLSNNQETTAGTDPAKPDTDEDGLSDGEEVNQYGTDPKNRDSDNDTLTDGDEVNVHKTSPKDPDTDKDGMTDAIEIATGGDPLLPPTATSPPTGTATNTATAVPMTATPTPAATATPTLTPLPGGLWNGVWDSQCDYLPCGLVSLAHTEGTTTVSGTFADGAGTLVGILEEDRLTGTWTYGGENGTVDFWISPDGAFWQGNWNKTYSWCGVRSGDLYPSPCGVATWYGEWNTQCNGSSDLCGVVNLTQHGAVVEGVYADGAGEISGTASGSTLSGNWLRGASSGSIAFYIQGEGTQFNGNFNDDFDWCGRREAASLPDPCLNQGLIFIFPDLPIIVVTLQPILPIIPIILPTPTP